MKEVSYEFSVKRRLSFEKNTWNNNALDAKKELMNTFRYLPPTARLQQLYWNFYAFLLQIIREIFANSFYSGNINVAILPGNLYTILIVKG